jgi:hypothetical protein
MIRSQGARVLASALPVLLGLTVTACATRPAGPPTAECGNGVVEPGEACDGDDLAGASCSGHGFTTGTVTCTASCTLDTGACTACGNGVVEPGEACDGDDLAGASCASLGFTHGRLACDAACGLDAGACSRCGDGVCTAAEQSGDCPADCGWQEVASGDGYSCALRADARIWCWSRDAQAPAPLLDGVGFASVRASRDRACGELAGTLACWDRPGLVALLPQAVEGLSDVVAYAVGGGHACAVTADGQVACWGANHRGQLGDGTLEPRDLPVTVPGVDGAVAVAAGDAHTCALRGDGLVLCWGDDASGQLGQGEVEGTEDLGLEPRPVRNLASAVEVTTFAGLTCARTRDGAVHCWGGLGLGLGLPGESAVAETVPGLPHAVALTVGEAHACAVDPNEGLWCWGANASGQLGDGTTDDRTAPAQVAGLLRAARASAGAAHTCAVDGDAATWCWGEGAPGGDGNDAVVCPGNAACSPVPTPLP